MRDSVIQHLVRRFQAFEDLAAQLSDELLRDNLAVPRSKSLAEHFWCVIGARESYTRALEKGEWSGFACSLEHVDPAGVAETLRASARAFQRTAAGIAEWTDARHDLLADLLEHEAMHEGQMIRHVYALERPLPASFKWA